MRPAKKLIVAAENLFALHGYKSVSVRAIAAAAGVNWSLLGYYFRGKEGLLFEVYRRNCNTLNAERFQLLKATRAESQPPQLEKVIEAFVWTSTYKFTGYDILPDLSLRAPISRARLKTTSGIWRNTACDLVSWRT
jgi:AcrR family transcriptional regulator